MIRAPRLLFPAIAALLVAVSAGAQGARPAASGRGTATPRMTAAPKGPIAAIEARRPNPAGPFARLTEVQRDSVVEGTRALLGVRYKWAGTGPERGVDCSGLVRYVFSKMGIDLPHSAAQLARLGEPVERDTSEMRPGDLLVFSKPASKRISHVGVYVGDGVMVHASSTNRRVVETPVAGYGLKLRGVRRVFSVDSAGASGN